MEISVCFSWAVVLYIVNFRFDPSLSHCLSNRNYAREVWQAFKRGKHAEALCVSIVHI